MRRVGLLRGAAGRWIRAAALALACGAAVAWLGWQAACDPEVPFLAARAPAEWVLHATAADTDARPAAEREVAFRTSFALDGVPERATLRLRVHRHGTVQLNGRELLLPDRVSWKRERAADATALLRPGGNELVVRARASKGPPAAWVVLEGPGLLVASDDTWTSESAGSGRERVRLARTPMSGWAERPLAAEATGAALRRSLPWLALFALASAAALAAGRRFGGPPAGLLLAAVALATAVLFWHNRALPPNLGFDADAHLAYLRLILDAGRLPLADEGWQTYQPPLYYAAGALLSALGAGEAGALRLLTALALVASCAALIGSLRILFPSDPTRVLAGTLLGASLPMQLYLSQYATNEPWSAAFASLSIWLALHVLARRESRAGVHLALGALLGAALLTKFSTLLALAAVLAALAARLAASGERSPRVWARTLGGVLLACVAVAGWHYARVALRFGDPFIGNWDAAAGVAWWQDPGFRSAGDYLRFGQSLTRPVFSAFHSCPDALYSTLWGDGLLGGSARALDAPPWSYRLMLAGYWLALLPSIGVLVGLALALRDLVREPRAEWLLLLGLAGATGVALVGLSLQLPFYAQCKAFYGLQALVPFAAFGAQGLDLLARRLGRAGDLVWVLLGTWALCAWATYWAR
jgi:4-amino-4-deoxy-L-arabinose transferase-like glycosyltransferase